MTTFHVAVDHIDLSDDTLTPTTTYLAIRDQADVIQPRIDSWST